MRDRVVFFGPWVGEFGWEYMWWQGWVRRVCRERFYDHHRIAASFPGRHVFYPYAEEFWPNPSWLAVESLSGHGYITDYWRNGWPKPSRRSVRWSLFGRRWVKERVEGHEGPDLEPQVVGLLEDYRRRLPPETLWFAPWAMNTFAPDHLRFGVAFPALPKCDEDFVYYSIPLDLQWFEPLTPTALGQRTLTDLGASGLEFIAVFPRHRRLRRPDKNWARDRWDALLRALASRFPDVQIALLGEPGGAHYGDGVPRGCLDLINVAPGARLDAQLAVLQRSRAAVGPMSGAIVVAQAAGAPTVTWDYQGRVAQAAVTNFFDTPTECLPTIDPSVESVLRAVEPFATASANSRPVPQAVPLHRLRERQVLLVGEFRFDVDRTVREDGNER